MSIFLDLLMIQKKPIVYSTEEEEDDVVGRGRVEQSG